MGENNEKVTLGRYDDIICHMAERALSPEATRQKLAVAVGLINTNLFSGVRLTPKRTTDLEHILNKRVYMLDDATYKEAKRVVCLKGDTSEAVKLNREVIEEDQSAATYIHPFVSGEEKKVIIRESFVGDPATSTIHIVQVLLEELAHSFYRDDREMRLDDIPNSTVPLLPYKTKEELLITLNRMRETYFGKTPTDPTHVTAIQSGFATCYVGDDLLGEGETTLYPIFLEQMALEEVRALILQSLFLAKVLGSQYHPRETTSKQLLLGIKKYIELAQSKSFFLNTKVTKYGGRQIDGMDFVLLYCQIKSFKDDAVDLVQRLYEADSEKLLQYLHSHNRVALETFQRMFERQL